jgi:hypothetical protein
MIIEFSVALLEQLKLTPNEFFVAKMIKHKEFDLLKKFLMDTMSQEESEKIFIHLQYKKYLTSTSYLSNYYDYSNCKIGIELNSLLKVDNIFEELLETYPSSVIRTDGVVDYLRTDQKTCKNMYLKLSYNKPAYHQHILKCLRFEVDKRTNDGSLKFMPRMSKWLTTEAWKSYEDEMNKLPSNKVKYGTELE